MGMEGEILWKKLRCQKQMLNTELKLKKEQILPFTTC